MSYFANAAQLLLEFAFGAAVTLFVLRILAELWRVQFQNPVSQFLYRYSNPVLAPVRRIIPNWGRINLAAALVALVLELVKLGMEFALHGMLPRPFGWLVLGLGQLLDMTMLIYIVLVFGWSLSSLVGGDTRHPLLRFVSQLVEPPLLPLRRRMPTMGGLDFSPAVAILVLFLLRILVAQPIIDLGAHLAVAG
jgi:YggT family protein